MMTPFKKCLIDNKIFLNYDPIKDRIAMNMTQTRMPTIYIDSETFENMFAVDFIELVEHLKKIGYYDKAILVKNNGKYLTLFEDT